MKKTPEAVAKELHEILINNGLSVLTIPNDKLYEISGRERIRGAFLYQLKEKIEEIGHIFASGDKVHVVSQDTNHSPAK